MVSQEFVPRRRGQVNMGHDVKRVDVGVLPVDDVETTKAVYRDVLERPVTYVTADFARHCV